MIKKLRCKSFGLCLSFIIMKKWFWCQKGWVFQKLLISWNFVQNWQINWLQKQNLVGERGQEWMTGQVSAGRQEGYDNLNNLFLQPFWVEKLLRWHNMSKFKADGLPQQKSTAHQVPHLSAKNRNLRLEWAHTHPNWILVEHCLVFFQS